MQNHADRAARIHDVPGGGRLAEYPGTRSILPRKLRNQPGGLDAARRLGRGDLEDVRHGLIHRAAYLNHVPVDNVNRIAATSPAANPFRGVLCCA